MRKQKGWRQKHENELRDYFSSTYKAEAGLGCGLSFGGRFGGGGNPGDVPPPAVVRIWGESARTRMLRVEQALDYLRTGYGKSIPARPHLFSVLAAHYTPRAAAELAGMGAIKGDPAVAVLTVAVRRATEAWMHDRLEADLSSEQAAHLASNVALAEKADNLREESQKLGKTPAGYRARLKLAAIEAPAPIPDIARRVRDRWERPPTKAELVSVLRRACREACNPSPGRASAARKASARKLCRTADVQAKRDLESAQREYARIRDFIDRTLGARQEANRFETSLNMSSETKERAIRLRTAAEFRMTEPERAAYEALQREIAKRLRGAP